ncbi:hypothetical protein F5887DRAFT_919051 [Amanita rubescens]|nr:hypothetical protein F5887DRAFT_919051 [Amanita rubescens]
MVEDLIQPPKERDGGTDEVAVHDDVEIVAKIKQRISIKSREVVEVEELDGEEDVKDDPFPQITLTNAIVMCEKLEKASICLVMLMLFGQPDNMHYEIATSGAFLPTIVLPSLATYGTSMVLSHTFLGLILLMQELEGLLSIPVRLGQEGLHEGDHLLLAAVLRRKLFDAHSQLCLRSWECGKWDVRSFQRWACKPVSGFAADWMSVGIGSSGGGGGEEQGKIEDEVVMVVVAAAEEGEQEQLESQKQETHPADVDVLLPLKACQLHPPGKSSAPACQPSPA